MAAEPESDSAGAAALSAPPVTDGPVFNVKVKFGKQVVPLAINVGAGVPPILQQLASLTKVLAARHAHQAPQRPSSSSV